MSSIRIRTGTNGVTFNALWRDEDGTQRSKVFRTRSEAKAFLKPHGQVFEKAPVVVGSAGSVASYAATWIESHPLKPAARQNYEYTLTRHIVPALGSKKMTRVTRADVYVAMKKWQAAGMSPALQAKCRVMTSMFEDAVQRGLIPTNPARGIKISKQVVKEMRTLDVHEYLRVLKFVPEQYRLMVRLAVASGARFGELAELRGTDIIGDTVVISRNVAELKSPHRYLVQATTKNGRARRVKISHELAEELHALGDGLLFPHNGGHQSREAFGRMFRKAQIDAGMNPKNLCRVHDLRHTAISWWLADGMPLSSVRDRAGHWNISVTSRYIHATADAEDEALSRSAA